MSFLNVPDVFTMYQALFPGGEFIGEVFLILKDSYAFLSKHVDPEEGGRALVLAIFSLILTVLLLVQRRMGNTQTLFASSLGALAMHGSMVTLFGAPWFIYPLLDYLFRNGRLSSLVLLTSCLSMFVGWGQDCMPSLCGFRQRMSRRWSLSGDEAESSWGWAIVFFSLLLTCFGIVLYRCVGRIVIHLMILSCLEIFCVLEL
jgi:hypothetical protein